jgi:hypothetical protein
MSAYDPKQSSVFIYYKDRFWPEAAVSQGTLSKLRTGELFRGLMKGVATALGHARVIKYDLRQTIVLAVEVCRRDVEYPCERFRKLEGRFMYAALISAYSGAAR